MTQAETLRGHAIMHFCSAFTRSINPTSPVTIALAKALTDKQVSEMADALDRAATLILGDGRNESRDVARLWIEKAKTIRLMLNSPEWSA